MSRPLLSDPCGLFSLQLFIQNMPDGSEIRIPEGIYPFHPDGCSSFTCFLSNSDPSKNLKAGLFLEGRQDLILDGQGSTLLCHGQMSAAALLNCKNITLKNFIIDWDIPMTAEGRITAVRDDSIDVSINSKLFPFHVENNTLYFDGGDFSHKLHFWGHTEFDPSTRRLAVDRGDRFPPTRQQLLPDGQVRFAGDFREKLPAIGNILVLRHGPRLHPGMLIHNCQNIHLQNIRMYANGGLGILAQFSDTLSFSHIHMGPAREKGRQFACCHDDGIHLSADSGEIRIEDCFFEGLMDDPVNLHGIAARAEPGADGSSFRGIFMHPQSKGHRLWAEPGHVVALLNGETMEELARASVKDYRLLNGDQFEITFENAPDLSLYPPGTSLSLENLSRTASLICRRNHFGSCRARGLLVTTPRPVLIEDNVFKSAGAAIRIAGDVCTWYESGRCRNVTIRNNQFLDSCLTNAYQGGQGIISISPELPRPEDSHPCHRNIRILNNHFTVSDGRILYALCTENLQFCGNQITKSTACPYQESSTPYNLEHCRFFTEKDNVFLGF